MLVHCSYFTHRDGAGLWSRIFFSLYKHEPDSATHDGPFRAVAAYTLNTHPLLCREEGGWGLALVYTHTHTHAESAYANAHIWPHRGNGGPWPLNTDGKPAHTCDGRHSRPWPLFGSLGLYFYMIFFVNEKTWSERHHYCCTRLMSEGLSRLFLSFSIRKIMGRSCLAAVSLSPIPLKSNTYSKSR